MLLFWRKGYAATSVEDLVETLHLSRSSLYDTFGDKRTLFLAALKLYSERVIRRMTQTLKDAPSPIGGLQTIFAELTAGVGTESGNLGCFMVNSVAELVPYDPDVTKIAADYTETLQQLFTDALKHDGVTRKQPPDELAAYVFNIMQGLRVLIKSGASKEQIEAICAITLQSLQ